MTGTEKRSPSSPDPTVVEEILRPLAARELLRIRALLIENPQRHATRIKILDRILADRDCTPLYSGPLGPRSAARDHAFYLATTRGIDPFSRSPKYGLMFATDVDDDGVVTYKAASSF